MAGIALAAPPAYLNDGTPLTGRGATQDWTFYQANGTMDERGAIALETVKEFEHGGRSFEIKVISDHEQ